MLLPIKCKYCAVFNFSMFGAVVGRTVVLYSRFQKSLCRMKMQKMKKNDKFFGASTFFHIFAKLISMK